MAYLTDDEKRLLFSALLREKKVCKEIDKNSKDTSSKMLVPIVVSIQNKFKYNKFEQDIYEKAYKDGQDKGLSDGRFFGRNEAIDEFAEKLLSSLTHNYRHFIKRDTDGFDWLTTDAVETHIQEIVKQLKEGE